ncbi:SatD family protein [Microbacterium sp. NPDC091313]
MTAAVIADIVGSRRLDDRSGAQRVLEATIDRVERERPLARLPLTSTVGDEFQGVYERLEDALAGLLLLQLALPDDVQCRYGVGIGSIGPVASRAGARTDGPGWWAARRAIDRVHALEQRAAPSARTWVEAEAGEDAAMPAALALANAYLLARDQLVGAMSERTRRLLYGRCLGRTQTVLAAEEGITQSAVSQALATAGAGAVLEGFTGLDGAGA